MLNVSNTIGSFEYIHEEAKLLVRKYPNGTIENSMVNELCPIKKAFVAYDVLQVLIELEKLKIRHNDVKYANFVFDDYYNCRIIDFATAQHQFLPSSNILKTYSYTMLDVEAFRKMYNESMIIKDLSLFDIHFEICKAITVCNPIHYLQWMKRICTAPIYGLFAASMYAPKITTLELGNLPAGIIESQKITFKFIMKSLVELKKLTIYSSLLDDEAIAVLGKFPPSVFHLSFFNNKIRNIAQFVDCTKLQVLNLSCNPINVSQINHMFDTGHEYKSLVSLHLKNCPISDEGLNHLSNVAFPNLQELQVSGIVVKCDISKSLATLIERCSELIDLRAASNYINDEGFVSIVAKCKHLLKLKYVHLEQNFITENGLKAAADFPQTLVELHLDANKFIDISNLQKLHCPSLLVLSCNHVVQSKKIVLEDCPHAQIRLRK